jgi:hypothetical protein
VEAFQQTVTGFTPGHGYTLTFHQSNLGAGESNLGGSWGAVASWQLYLDGVATGLYSDELQPEVGPVPNNTWFASSITFTATASNHALGFGPHSTNGKNAFLGIDGIAIQAALPVERASWGEVKAMFLE